MINTVTQYCTDNWTGKWSLAPISWLFLKDVTDIVKSVLIM